jgi:HEAT repeat protein
VKDAAIELGEIGDSRAVEPLIKALGDKDEYVREAATKALGMIADVRAVEPLIEVLWDEDQLVHPSEYVRYYAAEALGNIGDTRAVEPLIKLLKGDDCPGCDASIEESWHACPSCGEPLHDDNHDAAKEALKKLGHEVE